jgi:NADPH:quinone reductase-like Zn-dependent oxidoreductase
MKKLIYRQFGGLEVLELADVAVPTPGAGEVLVRVRAAAINPVDWKMREGHVKFLTGWRMPQGQGVEFAGVVERIGDGVTGYAAGDEVFGEGRGCIAEFCLAKVGRIAKKPEALSFAIASTIPAVGTTAASAFDGQRVQAGAEVLVNGATGGIGMFATQMAVRRGAHVTAVVSDKGVALAERWGAARVVNYRSTNILDDGRSYDVIFELSDKLPFKAAKPLLKPGGTFVASLPNPAEFIPGFVGNLVSPRKYALMGMRAKPDTLRAVASEVATGGLEVVIGETVALSEFSEAYARAASGKLLGKSVFVMRSEGDRP